MLQYVKPCGRAALFCFLLRGPCQLLLKLDMGFVGSTAAKEVQCSQSKGTWLDQPSGRKLSELHVSFLGAGTSVGFSKRPSVAWDTQDDVRCAPPGLVLALLAINSAHVPTEGPRAFVGSGVPKLPSIFPMALRPGILRLSPGSSEASGLSPRIGLLLVSH